MRRSSAASAPALSSRDAWPDREAASSRAGVRRLVVAGGETAGAVVQALGVTGLRIGRQIDPGVPWTVSLPRSRGEPPLALALKSGNFGTPDFFLRAFSGAGRRARMNLRASTFPSRSAATKPSGYGEACRRGIASSPARGGRLAADPGSDESWGCKTARGDLPRSALRSSSAG